MRLQMILSIGLIFTVPVSAAPLTDITGSSNQTAIEFLQEQGIINGYADGSFKPSNTINRAELLKILVGSVGITPSVKNYHDCFSDVRSEWFAPFVCYAKEKKWINGYADGSFKPGQTVNTAEAIKMTVNVYGYELMQTSSAAPFSDVDLSAWYAPYVLLARDAGILDVQKGKIGIAESMTRGRISGIIYRSVKNRNATGGYRPAAGPGIVESIYNKLRRGGGGSGAGNSGGGGSQTSSNAVLLSPTISLSEISKNYGDSGFTVTATSNSAGTFTYVSSNAAVATIAGNTVTIIGAGSTTITVTQAANGDYTSGSTTAVLTVNPIAPTIGTFNAVNKYLGDIPFTLTAPSSNSAGAFSYVSGSTGVATVAGNTVTLVSNGTSTITATQAANGNYTSGTKTMTLTVYFGGCVSEPCLNGGICTNAPGGDYSCECADGFSGYSCEMDASNCAVDGDFFCLNGGTCTPTPTHGECTCTECFMGSRCEQFNSMACA